MPDCGQASNDSDRSMPKPAQTSTRGGVIPALENKIIGLWYYTELEYRDKKEMMRGMQALSKAINEIVKDL